MKKQLLGQTVTKFLCGVVLVGILIFLPAGTLFYPQGWLLMGVLFAPMAVVGIVLFIKSPELLRKRLQSKEKQLTQKKVVALSGLGFLTGFILSGLDFRFGWSMMPTWVIWLAAALFLIGYGTYAEVLRENAYLSRTVEVAEEQKVIDSGLYGIIRHPMYLATILMFPTIPLILGSWYGAIVFLPYPVLIAVRIRGEEKLLEAELTGYMEYKQKVKYRLLPLIW